MIIQSLSLTPSDFDNQALEHWFRCHQVWGKLPAAAREDLVHALEIITVEPNMVIYQQQAKPLGIYFLISGTVEISHSTSVGKNHIIYRNAGELFGYLQMMDNPYHPPLTQKFAQIETGETATHRASALALTKCEIWFLEREKFDNLKQIYPEIQGIISDLLLQDVENFSQRLAKEQVRIQALQPHIRPVPSNVRVIGISRAAQKITQQVKDAATDLQPVILQAPSGSGKTFIAGLIHSQSKLKDRSFAEIDLSQLPTNEKGEINTDDLFGSVNGPIGVLELLEKGTLLIENVQLLNESEWNRLTHYLNTGIIIPNGLDDVSEVNPVIHQVRLILASAKTISLPDVRAIHIKLSSLPQRKQDIPSFAQYFICKFCRETGRPTLQLSQADLRRLISYDYPGNIAELEAILKRAVIMTPLEEKEIPEQVLWSVQSNKNAFRVDLLNELPWLRPFLLSKWWPDGIWQIMMIIFIPVLLLGFFGVQTRDKSITLHIFWAWWWPFYLLLFPLVGRLWCAVCPFMITAEWLRKLSLWIWPRQLLPWPNKWLNQWGAWILWGGFVMIYIWEKLWDLPHHAYLSAWLLLIITAGAVIFSMIYERRLWCRYLCPIGGMNGMFAKLAMTEYRSTQQVCGSQCNSFGCYKGSERTPVNFVDALPNEGQATVGCPIYSHPAQLIDNRDCILCMSCLKGCPNRSAQLNLRFPAADLLENHHGFWAEVALLLLLLGGMFMHYSHSLLSWFGLGDIPIDSEHLLISLPIVILLLSIPFFVTYSAHYLARIFDTEMPDYLRVIYAYLPMTLAANLVYYIPSMVTESGQILQVIARNFGYTGAGLPSLTWSLDVASFLQQFTLLSILAFSLFPLVKITQRPLLNNFPHIITMTGLIFAFFQLSR